MTLGAVPWSCFAAAVLSAMVLAAAPAAGDVVLHRGNGSDPETLDPAHATFEAENNILRDLYEGLVTYDEAGNTIPGDAESWAVSADGLTYTFTIRADARWSNGDPVTADDYVYSFRRVEDPKQSAGYAGVLYPIRNAEAVNTATPDSPVDVTTLGVKALDAHTLQITLEHPTPYFITLLAEPAALPVYRPAVEKYGTDFTTPANLVSNGAFTLADDVANDHVTLARNPEFWDAANVKLDKVVFYPTDDQGAAVRRFQAGSLDLDFPFPADRLDELRQSLGADQVHLTPGLATYYYVFDERHPPFDDVRVRQALSMAIDRTTLAASAYAGAELPLYSVVPLGLPGYAPAAADFSTMSEADRQAKAKALLEQAGYGPDGKPLNVEIRYNTGSDHGKIASAIAAMWKALGVTVTTVALDTKAHYAYLRQSSAFSVARVGWSPDYPDPEDYLFQYVSADKTFNVGGYANPRYDALIQRSEAESDPAKRMQALHDAEALLVADQPITPLLVAASPWLVSRRVVGWQDNAANVHLSRFLSLGQ
jgi:oligopeptide transport system substrate-binding protein